MTSAIFKDPLHTVRLLQ